MRAALIALAALTLAGCYTRTISIDDPDGAPLPYDAGPRRDAGYVPPTGKCVEASGADVLFVIDNSNSMTEEQASLVIAIPELLRSLIEPPDEDGDGERDWLPVTDLQVGVVTTDMGSGGNTVPTCARSDFGDDGILRTAGRTDLAGCMATYPSFLAYSPATMTVEELAMDLGCVATVGTGGCGFEQQLEAGLKAVAPALPTAYTGPGYAPPTFFNATRGHGSTENAGFVRNDTMLAVVVVTDEEDCSASDADLFNPSSPTYGTTDLNLRCFSHPDALHPVSRYVEGLRALRAGREDLLAYAVIAGVPTDLAAPVETAAHLDAILADPRMQERVDPAMPTRLVPSCNEPGRGLAFPPRRLVQVARGLGPSRSTVQSICQEDYVPVVRAVARLIGRRACATREGP